MQAVLTGDIVGSSTLTPEAHRQGIGIIKSMADAYPETVVGAVDVFSGDSWQMLLSDGAMALRIALYLRASLKRNKALAIDSRVSIALGSVDMAQVNAARISESTGALFTASGRGLSGLKKPSLMCMTDLSDAFCSVAMGGTVRLMDAMVRQWSPEQARAIAETLQGKTQAEIAAQLGVSQPAVHKSLQTACWGEIEASLNDMEQLMALSGTGCKR